MLKAFKNKKLVIAAAVFCALLIAVIVFSAVSFTPVKKQLIIEAGAVKTITEDEFKRKDGFEVKAVTNIAEIELDKTGRHTVEFSYKDKTYKTILNIVDTTAPSATPVESEVIIGANPTAQSFVTDIKDFSEVTVDFAEKVSFDSLGDKTVKVVLTDEFNNTATLSVKIKVVKDTAPPVFEGLDDISVRIGETVSYRAVLRLPTTTMKSWSFPSTAAP